jgi:TIR domain-containing protein
MRAPDPDRPQVFISYSHHDKEWLDRLRVHLRPLEREALLEVWDDTKIAAGKRWREEIQKAIEAASVAVILVSPDFLASDFIAGEELPPLLEAAERRGTTLLLLLVAPCWFEKAKFLSPLQAVNAPKRTLLQMDRAEQEATFVTLAEKVHAILTRPITELREKIERKYREIDREFEAKIRQIRSDATLSNKDQEFLSLMWRTAMLDRKRNDVLEELTAIPTGPRHDYLFEELRRLGRERDQVQERLRQHSEEGNRNLRDLIRRSGLDKPK